MLTKNYPENNKSHEVPHSIIQSNDGYQRTTSNLIITLINKEVNYLSTGGYIKTSISLS